ncbi:hypothetical protein KPH14_002610 [Odynerus spinipes]|uniref:Odorant receptor n=1 Tax=Odynerus spinipes TaxID=1348599 RepID=A0AAD9R884_9HYME|nr:hypothetical protein KPH14_002610 [Odynerus spinipes]
MKKKDSIEIVDVFVLHEWYYKIGGVWPLKRDYIKFGMFVVYSLINIIAAYIDTIAVFGNLHLMVENLLETLVITMSLFMVLVVYFHPSLSELITTVKNEIAKEDYQTNEERSLYYAYNRIAYGLSKVAMTSSVITVMAMYMKPLPSVVHALYKSLGNNGTPVDADVLVIPFKGMAVLNITDIRIYFVLYVYRLPCVYLGICHTLTICFILSLVLHICGKLSIIKQRVQMFDTSSKNKLDTAIRHHVQIHLQLIDMVKLIEDIFQYILLLDLVQTSVRLGLSSYVALTSKDAGSEFLAMCTFASYASLLFVLLYVYCFVGEYLTQESKDLTEAYYQCNWQEMPLSCKSSLLICMISSQTHLNFTAGKFYKFSLYGFTGIVKTSMAYLSMLRTVI